MEVGFDLTLTLKWHHGMIWIVWIYDDLWMWIDPKKPTMNNFDTLFQ